MVLLQAGHVPGGEAGSRASAPYFLSLCSSQDLKFNCISKEINFKVPFYAVYSLLHATACAGVDSPSPPVTLSLP